MIAQLPPSGCPPSAPQRTHWNAYEIGFVPVHVPRDAFSRTPCSARPLIDGSAVFDGAVACAATPCAAGRTSADSASAVTTAPLEVIDPSLGYTGYDVSGAESPRSLADLLQGLTSSLRRRLGCATALRRHPMTD